MKFTLLASLIAAATAFAPAKSASKTTSLNSFEDALGAQLPLGFYDPLGFLDGADEARFDRLREVELKHGRVCMLAFVGNLVPRAGIYLPGNIDLAGDSFDSYPPGIAALFSADSAIPPVGILQMVFVIGLVELFVMKDVTGEGEFAGDFRNGFDFGWDDFSEETKLRKRAIELNNGRAAQMGILGLMMHECVDGNPVVGLFVDYN